MEAEPRPPRRDAGTSDERGVQCGGGALLPRDATLRAAPKGAVTVSFTSLHCPVPS